MPSSMLLLIHNVLYIRNLPRSQTPPLYCPENRKRRQMHQSPTAQDTANPPSKMEIPQETEIHPRLPAAGT
jgi:hypothetical protein